MFWLKEVQTVGYIKIKYYKFPSGEATAILTKVVMSHLLFQAIQASVINTI